MGYITRGGGSTFWPANDVELVNCEGTGCEGINDWDSSLKYQSYLYFFEHENYDSHKTYIFSNGTKHIFANRTLLSQVEVGHRLMSLAKENWGLNLTSAETVKSTGALTIMTMHPSTGVYE